MALLDVSEALVDPMLLDTFDVVRRAETVNSTTGRSEVTEATTAGVSGVVCSAGPNDLQRLPEQDRMGRHISVVTLHRLRGPTPGYKADILVWKGDRFLVKVLDPYPQFGRGFVQVIAGSVDNLDQPVP